MEECEKLSSISGGLKVLQDGRAGRVPPVKNKLNFANFNFTVWAQPQKVVGLWYSKCPGFNFLLFLISAQSSFPSTTTHNLFSSPLSAFLLKKIGLHENKPSEKHDLFGLYFKMHIWGKVASRFFRLSKKFLLAICADCFLNWYDVRLEKSLWNFFAGNVKPRRSCYNGAIPYFLIKDLQSKIWCLNASYVSEIVRV